MSPPNICGIALCVPLRREYVQCGHPVQQVQIRAMEESEIGTLAGLAAFWRIRLQQHRDKASLRAGGRQGQPCQSRVRHRRESKKQEAKDVTEIESNDESTALSGLDNLIGPCVMAPTCPSP